jgi:hypothetical protein
MLSANHSGMIINSTSGILMQNFKPVCRTPAEQFSAAYHLCGERKAVEKDE